MLLSPVVDDFEIVRLCVFASSKPCRISLILPKPHSNDTDFLQGGGSSIVNQSGHDDRGKMRDAFALLGSLGLLRSGLCGLLLGRGSGSLGSGSIRRGRGGLSIGRGPERLG